MNGERFFLLLAGVVCIAASGRGDNEDRVWTNADGREVTASLVRAGDSDVRLELESGREAEVALSRLSDADVRYVERMRERGRAFDLAPLPEETQAPRDAKVEGGPRVFRTPHFEFEADRDVSRAFIAEAARVCEGTHLALSRLPHGLPLRPPGGRDHYRGVFLSEPAFRSIVAETAPTIAGQRVVGLYVPGRRELLVPYSSIGAKELGSRLTLRKSSDTSTLVHEIVHQVMHDWLPLLPTWFSEGLAEYLAAVPYQNARFEFRNAERGLEERLETHYRFEEDVLRGVRRPSHFLAPRGGASSDRNDVASLTGGGGDSPAAERSAGEAWSGTAADYRDALLFMYFLMHLDRPEAPGNPVAAYLRLVDVAMGETDRLQSDIRAYERNRRAYNRAVDRFNARMKTFRRRAASYNERARRYNRQVARGVPEEERVEVGDAPQKPEQPARPGVPESVERVAVGGAIDLVAVVRDRARPALLRGRSARELDAAVKAAYARMGLEIAYRD